MMDWDDVRYSLAVTRVGSLSTAANQPGLVRVLPKAPIPKRDVWLVTHPDLREVARIRAILDYLAAAFRRDRTVFDPEG